MTLLDWLVVLAYFALLFAVAWWVIRSGQGHRRRLLPGRPQPRLVRRRRVDLRLEHRLGAPRRPGRRRGHQRRRARALRAARVVPAGARLGAGAVLHAVARLHDAGVPRAALLAGVALGPVADLAGRLRAHQDRGRHLRRRRRLRHAAARSCSSSSAASCFNSFWIGSVLVVVLTGVYTVLGGMRAVAYTEAIQTLILVIGSLLLTIYGLNVLGGWGELRAVLGPRCSTCGSRWCRPASRARGRRSRKPGRIAWYFNGDYPWLGMLFCAPIVGLWYWCTDQYIVQRTLGAPNETRGAPRHHLRRVPQAAAGLHLHHPGHDRAGAGQDRPGRRAVGAGRTGDGQVVPSAAQAAFPLMVRDILPTGVRGIVVAGPARRAHELARRRVQRLLDALHDRLLRRSSGPARRRRSWCGSAASRPSVMVLIGLAWIPVIQGARGLYEYLQGVSGYLGAADLHRLLLRRVHEAPERRRAALAALLVGFGDGRCSAWSWTRR